VRRNDENTTSSRRCSGGRSEDRGVHHDPKQARGLRVFLSCETGALSTTPIIENQKNQIFCCEAQSRDFEHLLNFDFRLGGLARCLLLCFACIACKSIYRWTRLRVQQGRALCLLRIIIIKYAYPYSKIAFFFRPVLGCCNAFY
jgi:hypothetical protein